MSISVTVIVINLFVFIALVISLFKSKEKTKLGFKNAFKSLIGILPYVIIIILGIGVMQGFLSKEIISSFLGENSGFWGVILAGLLGAVLFIPALISFPLTASLIDSGASIMVAAAFITTLTMVGFITLPLEIKVLGKKFALLRNLLSFIIAIIIAVLIGVFLG
jgi:uncharacterized membrane protein YraQ (UPF0718 family)